METKSEYIRRKKGIAIAAAKVDNTPIVNICEVIHNFKNYSTITLNGKSLLVVDTAKGQVFYELTADEQVFYELIADDNAFDYVVDGSNGLIFVSSTCKRVMITIDPFNV